MMENTKKVAYVEYRRPDGRFAGAYPYGMLADFSDEVGGLFYQPYPDKPAHPRELKIKIIYKIFCVDCGEEIDACECR